MNTRIITRLTRRQQLEREKRLLVFKADFDWRLYWEIKDALDIAELFEQNRRPLCEHGLPHCPGCHSEKPYNPAWDVPAAGVQ